MFLFSSPKLVLFQSLEMFWIDWLWHLFKNAHCRSIYMYMYCRLRDRGSSSCSGAGVWTVPGTDSSSTCSSSTKSTLAVTLLNVNLTNCPCHLVSTYQSAVPTAALAHYTAVPPHLAAVSPHLAAVPPYQLSLPKDKARQPLELSLVYTDPSDTRPPNPPEPSLHSAKPNP